MKVTESLYYVYILSNKSKTVLYTGMTNNLEQRIIEHYIDRIDKKHFTGKYNCHFLIFYEYYKYVNDAIAREKEIKGWVRAKKNDLITAFNPGWKIFNEELLGEWPPNSIYHRKDI
ncbi:MAG: GIY-YIG nuclease family protein [Ferruginibacter sp.]